MMCNLQEMKERRVGPILFFVLVFGSALSSMACALGGAKTVGGPDYDYLEIRGVIEDGEGLPVQAAEVTTHPQTHLTHSESNGYFSIAWVDSVDIEGATLKNQIGPGYYTIYIKKAGYMPLKEELKIDGNMDPDFRFHFKLNSINESLPLTDPSRAGKRRETQPGAGIAPKRDN